MSSFYLYDDDGRIHLTGYCPESMIHLQERPGFHLGLGDAVFGKQYVDGGRLVDIPERPSPHHKFSYTTKQWEPDHAAAWSAVRSRRNQLLQESDWTQLPDVPIATKEAWAEYRQALRDITEQPDPFNIVWPVPPG